MNAKFIINCSSFRTIVIFHRTELRLTLIITRCIRQINLPFVWSYSAPVETRLERSTRLATSVSRCRSQEQQQQQQQRRRLAVPYCDRRRCQRQMYRKMYNRKPTISANHAHPVSVHQLSSVERRRRLPSSARPPAVSDAASSSVGAASRCADRCESRQRDS